MIGIIFLVFMLIMLVCIRKEKQKPGTGFIISGWLMTIIGGVGAIISFFIKREEEKDYVNRLSSYYYRESSNAEIAETALYIFLGVAILGIIFLIVGYIKRSNISKSNANQELLNTIVAMNQNATAHPVDEEVIICSTCGAKNNSNARFCYECGNKILKELVCSSCGEKNKPNAKFCNFCGNKFE